MIFMMSKDCTSPQPHFSRFLVACGTHTGCLITKLGSTTSQAQSAKTPLFVFPSTYNLGLCGAICSLSFGNLWVVQWPLAPVNVFFSCWLHLMGNSLSHGRGGWCHFRFYNGPHFLSFFIWGRGQFLYPGSSEDPSFHIPATPGPAGSPQGWWNKKGHSSFCCILFLQEPLISTSSLCSGLNISCPPTSWTMPNLKQYFPGFFADKSGHI